MNTQQPPPARPRRGGFSLIELVVAITVMAILLLMVFSMVDQTQETWSQASSRTSQFKEARVSFESMTRRIRQASLNTYWDYRFDAQERPQDYIRQSELHFVCGSMDDIAKVQASTYPTHGIFFQAPLGFSENKEYQNFTAMMNAWGYFLEYGDDRDDMPPFLQSRVEPRNRYRLMEFRRPAEELEIYEEAEVRRNTRRTDDNKWFASHLSGPEAPTRVLAENIVALVISPRTSEHENEVAPTDMAPTFSYDSRQGLGETGFAAAINARHLHLLPPLIQITMVAIDERTAAQLDRAGSVPNFIPAGVFVRAANIDQDIRTVEAHLQDLGMNYRVFTATVPMRAAKWTQTR
ncbi:MAG TPA: Verru_Chthon cassette protein C [Verrucomicrobiales bacterium]|nr:Verru_Chthon cassette protein C [Verrucomicrobiales bacterium]